MNSKSEILMMIEKKLDENFVYLERCSKQFFLDTFVQNFVYC